MDQDLSKLTDDELQRLYTRHDEAKAAALAALARIGAERDARANAAEAAALLKRLGPEAIARAHALAQEIKPSTIDPSAPPPKAG